LKATKKAVRKSQRQATQAATANNVPKKAAALPARAGNTPAIAAARFESMGRQSGRRQPKQQTLYVFRTVSNFKAFASRIAFSKTITAPSWHDLLADAVYLLTAVARPRNLRSSTFTLMRSPVEIVHSGT